MTLIVNIEEINTYILCPQREFYRKQNASLAAAEVKYYKSIQNTVVNFYNKQMYGEHLNYSENRKVWSRHWHSRRQVAVNDRQYAKHNISFSEILTDEEMAMFKGLEVLKLLVDHPLSKRVNTNSLFMVNEPISQTIGDITIEGNLDLAWMYSSAATRMNAVKEKIYLTRWVKNVEEYNGYNIVHSFIINYLQNILNREIDGIYLDSLLMANNKIERLEINQNRIQDDMKQIANVARAISQDIIYKNIGSHCRTLCPYTNICLGGVSIEDKKKLFKRTRGRPRKKTIR